ncbi:hypothetical protein [Botrimarina sp.]|uniref:hypothetical protein n=1 Tax=Botrimarina sp. TaxID=2795802 RepID=UPI0032EDC650
MHATPKNVSMPRWFRRTLIVLATLLLCSCRASGQQCPSCPVGQDCQPGVGGGVCLSDGCPCCQPRCFAGPGDEWLCDGGDQQFTAGVLKDDSLVGLEQEDTVAIYAAPDGRKLVAPSTRVCVYAPRFAAVRRVVHPMGALQQQFIGQAEDRFGVAEADRSQPTAASLQNLRLKEQAQPLPPGLYKGRQQAGGIVRRLAAADVIGQVGPYAMLQIMATGVMQMDEAPLVGRRTLAAITWTGDQELQIAIGGQAAGSLFSPKQPGLLYHVDEPNSPYLRLVKCASTDTALPGEEIEFTLRYDNIGDTPIVDLVIVDNLTARLEYVDDSANSSRDADFSTSRNDYGSLLLRWEIDGTLKPGEGGLLSFKCRVR